MVDGILSLLYDSTAIDKMGDMYQVIYSWSAFVLSMVYVLTGFVAFCMLLVRQSEWRSREKTKKHSGVHTAVKCA